MKTTLTFAPAWRTRLTVVRSPGSIALPPSTLIPVGAIVALIL